MIPALQNLQQYLATLSPAQQAVAKSYLLNIFQLNPWLSRFYADSLDLLAANPQQINNLPTRSAKKNDPDPKGSNPMALNTNVRICTHIKVNGVRCGSPALRSEVFCYFHQRMIRGVRTPPKSRLHPVAQIENEEGIQASLMEVIDALIRNTIDLRRANLILRALHIAARNSSRVHFGIFTDKMVHEVPQYPAAPAAAQPPAEAIAQAGALAEIPRPKPVSSKPAKVAAPAARVAPKPPARIPPASARALPPRAATPPRNAALQ